jgi:hypothetical protein
VHLTLEVSRRYRGKQAANDMAACSRYRFLQELEPSSFHSLIQFTCQSIRIPIGLSIFVVFVCFYADLAQFQEDYCDPRIPQIDTTYGYHMRENRCEGVSGRELDDTTLVVMSLTRSLPKFTIEKDETLHIFNKKHSKIF